MNDVADFLSWWFEHTSTRFVLTTIDAGEVKSRTFDDAVTAGEWATARAGGRNVYSRMTAVEQLTSARGAASDTVAVPGFWLDIDLEGPHHATAERLPTLVDARALLELIPPASAVVHSGGGLYALWRFAEPVRCANDVDRAAAMSRRFHEAVASIFAGYGRQTAEPFHLDNVSDLARILRPVGTINHKRQPLKAVRWEVEPTGEDHNAATLLDTVESIATEWAPADLEPELPEYPAPRVVSGCSSGEGPSGVFNSAVTLQDVLDTDTLHGPWSFVDERSERIGGAAEQVERWRRSGSSSKYSIKRIQSSGVVVVWSSVIAAVVGVQPGQGIDLFGFACGLNNEDPVAVASDIGRRARQLAREVPA